MCYDLPIARLQQANNLSSRLILEWYNTFANQLFGDRKITAEKFCKLYSDTIMTVSHLMEECGLVEFQNVFK